MSKKPRKPGSAVGEAWVKNHADRMIKRMSEYDSEIEQAGTEAERALVVGRYSLLKLAELELRIEDLEAGDG